MSSNLAQSGVPANARAGLEKMQAMQPLARYAGDATPILNRLLAGESIRQIADSHNISPVAVYTWLYRNAPEDWQAIMAGAQSNRLDTADEIYDRQYSGDARADGINISRAREISRNAQWHLERANRKLFGQKVDIDQNININQHLTVMLAPTGLLADRLNQAGAGVTIDAPMYGDSANS